MGSEYELHDDGMMEGRISFGVILGISWEAFYGGFRHSCYYFLF
jgi:hypothetical protein